MTDSQPTPPPIPGNDLPLPEDRLLGNVGKYLCLFEHEQHKRLILVQAYLELKAELDALKAPKYNLDEVIQGNP